jgi:3-hydroxymyristoyl/3-hydroxydecanoyl-(acyl carrier protein) dehydratase
MINLPDEVVIAGEPAGCLRVIDGLKGHVIRVPFDSVLHNPAMESEQSALAELYSYPVHANGQVTFYSAGRYAPLPLEREPLADILAHMTCQQLDFPRLVNTVYAGGARLFVEVGPQGTCTRWIDRILRGRDFAALPLNRPRAGDYEGVVAVLAMLVSHGVPVNLAPLYGLFEEKPGQSATHTLLPRSRPDHLSQQAALLAEGHQAFLQARHTAMIQTAELMQLQASLSKQMLALAGSQIGTPAAPRPRPLIDQAALRAFASGDPEACFGSAYAVYRGRRLPRLPNGDLLLVDRILTIDGTTGKVEAGASLISEYDVPADAWFLRQRSVLPHVALMELALQPCGVLAAYLGSTLPYPNLDFYFRNLDGQAELLCDLDVRRQTIVNRVRLLSSSALHGIILQKYEFELACGGAPFYRGTSSFGYFTREALNSQAGLGDAETAPTPGSGGEWAAVDLPRASHSQLDILEQAWVLPRGGRHGLGEVYAEAPVRSTDWYFKCHFYQDPVMPGSLGVEAVRQGVQILGRHLGAGRVSVGRPLPGCTTTWKYRGQMTPEEGRLRLDAHATQVSASGEGLALLAEASVWKDDCRLYEIKNLGMMLPSAPSEEG